MSEVRPIPASTRRLFWSVILVISALLAAFVWYFVIRRPDVSVSLTPAADGSWILDMRMNSQVNYIMNAWMGSKGAKLERIWQSPAGREYRKKEPPRIAIRPPKEWRIGEEFYIEVDFQWDSPAPSSGSQMFVFRLGPDGSAEYLGERPPIRWRVNSSEYVGD